MNNLSMGANATFPVMGAPAPPPLIELLHLLLLAAWRRRYLIITPMLILPVLGTIAGHFAPKMYEARMTVLIQEPGKLNPFLEDLSIKTNLKDRMAALSALLTSRYVMQSVALDIGQITKDTPEPKIDSVVADLATSVSVQLIGQEVVELRYRSKTPAGIDTTLMRIGERFMDRVEAPEDSSMRSSVVFLQKQLAESSARLEAAEGAVADYRAANAQALPDQRATNLQRLAMLRDSLSEHEVKLAGAHAEFDASHARLAQTDPVIGRLEQEINAARGDLAVLRSLYSDGHSKVQVVLSKLERLEAERSRLVTSAAEAPPVDLDRMWNMAAVARKDGDGAQPLLVSQVAALEAARIHLQELQSETENLRRSVSELSDYIESSGGVERELAKRMRVVAETQELHQTLQKRFEMAKVTGELSRFQAPERIKVIDRPTVPTAPMKPLTILFGVGGLFGGLFLGIGLAVLMELMDTTIRSARAMQKLMGVPVLGRLAISP